MKRLRILIGISLVLGFISAMALLVEYGALCDIAKVAAPVWEWYVVGVCMILTATFVTFTLIALGLAFRHLNQCL